MLFKERELLLFSTFFNTGGLGFSMGFFVSPLSMLNEDSFPISGICFFSLIGGDTEVKNVAGIMKLVGFFFDHQK